MVSRGLAAEGGRAAGGGLRILTAQGSGRSLAERPGYLVVDDESRQACSVMYRAEMSAATLSPTHTSVSKQRGSISNWIMYSFPPLERLAQPA